MPFKPEDIKKTLLSNEKLLTYVKNFYNELVKNYENQPKNATALDALASLLPSDEICAAVGLENSGIFKVATNRKDAHFLNQVDYKCVVTYVFETKYNLNFGSRSISPDECTFNFELKVNYLNKSGEKNQKTIGLGNKTFKLEIPEDHGYKKVLFKLPDYECLMNANFEKEDDMEDDFNFWFKLRESFELWEFTDSQNSIEITPGPMNCDAVNLTTPIDPIIRVFKKIILHLHLVAKAFEKNRTLTETEKNTMRYEVFTEICRFQLIGIKQPIKKRRGNGQQLPSKTRWEDCVKSFMEMNNESFRQGEFKNLMHPSNHEVINEIIVKINENLQSVEKWLQHEIESSTVFGKKILEPLDLKTFNSKYYFEIIGENCADHAEMKILFYSDSKDIGISKACCALCSLAMSKSSIQHRSHGIAFRNWNIPENLNFERFAGKIPDDLNVSTDDVKQIISYIGDLDDDFLKNVGLRSPITDLHLQNSN
jgi:hypothetical protein